MKLKKLKIKFRHTEVIEFSFTLKQCKIYGNDDTFFELFIEDLTCDDDVALTRTLQFKSLDNFKTYFPSIRSLLNFVYNDMYWHPFVRDGNDRIYVITEMHGLKEIFGVTEKQEAFWLDAKTGETNAN